PVIATPAGLGPAQLLLACGSEQQQQQYLPRLASGRDIGCFAVTSATAGTDAAAINDSAVVCHYDAGGGKQQLGLRLNWHKRHIALAPAATVIGLSVDVHDPQQLLGRDRHPGMTCLLVAADATGVEPARGQQPVGAAFPYGTTSG